MGNEMIRRLFVLVLGAGIAAPLSALAQEPLTLSQAIDRATSSNPDARIAAVAEQEAAQRVVQARAGYFPRADVTETWQRGNQPVYVFGSLLNQRRFTADDFALDALNHPDALDNFRVAFSVEQNLYDGGQTRARVAAARAGVDLAAAGRRRAGQSLAVAATEAYGQVLVAEASLRAADAALASADADLARVTNRRDNGLVTDADVLAVEVHRAAVQESIIRARAAVQIGQAELNRVMGAPLDTVHTLVPVATLAAATLPDLAVLEAEALANRPEATDASLRERLAKTEVDVARAAFQPQVFAQAGWEANGGTWGTRAGSWIAGAGVRLNVFRGFADRARLAEAHSATERSALEREQVLSGIRVEVRSAVAALEAARARETLAERVVAQAEEGQRIVRDRYEQGLADSTALTKAAEHVVQATQQQVRARVDVQLASATLERVLGR
jgi:outer membrane protein TolC